ncbi:MAG: DUF5683 domain-containing protein [bacterium]
MPSQGWNFTAFYRHNPPLRGAQGGIKSILPGTPVLLESEIKRTTKNSTIFAMEKQQWKNNISQPFPGLAPADTLARKKAKNPTGAMVRSIFFPGWGQLYNGKWLKALIVFGAEAGFIGTAIYLNQKAHDDRETALNRELYADMRNTNYWRTGVAILISMLDAFVDAHLSDFDESPDLSANSVLDFGSYGANTTADFRVAFKIEF